MAVGAAGAAMPTFRYEREARLAAGTDMAIVGIDEVGRGPLAGPVVAAAVMFEAKGLPRRLARAIDDSKKLTAAEREHLAPLIAGHAIIAIAHASVTEIDTINILQASLLAMQRAVAALAGTPALALVDGNIAPVLPCPARAVVNGDALCLSIAAASIVAKVWRDRFMAELAALYPAYGWERNAGYATPEHRSALQRWGPTPEHRRSFRPVYEQIGIMD
jgi:ribonuclease HII